MSFTGHFHELQAQNGRNTLHIGAPQWGEFWWAEERLLRNVKVIAMKAVEQSSGGRAEAKHVIYALTWVFWLSSHTRGIYPILLMCSSNNQVCLDACYFFVIWLVENVVAEWVACWILNPEVQVQVHKYFLMFCAYVVSSLMFRFRG